MNRDAILATRRRLAEIEAERESLQRELRRLETEEACPAPASAEKLTAAQKVGLVLDLFGARRSVHASFWQNPGTGKQGYAPVRRAGQLIPLDTKAVEAHLRGKQTLGVYAIREDDSCIFLAADFDGSGWRDDVRAYAAAGAAAGVPVAIERSRSGNGAHAWIFLAEPAPSALARRLGTLLLARAGATRPAMGLRTYDRFFPNQDTLPQGGFGNLIALPLAREPRQHGNTVFVDESFTPWPDQWAFLATVPRLSREKLDALLVQLAPAPVQAGPSSAAETWALRCDERALDLARPVITSSLMTGEAIVTLRASVSIDRHGLPSPLLAGLKRLATFPNPIFYQKQRLRFSTYNTPRFIFAGELHEDRLVLPRGLLAEAVKLIESAGGKAGLIDTRPEPPGRRWKFQGELRPEQRQAVRAMGRYEHGVLVAPPGAGKTVMACALLARHRTSALVLVHRKLLLEQWRTEAARFLGLKPKEVGVWRGDPVKLTGKLDLAMLPSLARLADPAALFARYGLVIVDECHHVPAVTFEAVMKACVSRRVLGLTATLERKDGLQKLLPMQCGPVRHEIAAAPSIALPKRVQIWTTRFEPPAEAGPQSPLHLVWPALVSDPARNAQIAAGIAATVEQGRFPLVLSDRKNHLDLLMSALAVRLQDIGVFRFDAGVGVRERRRMREEIDRRVTAGEKTVLFATASLIGEGFDLPRLDTLFLAMPLSWSGRLIQYAGRLHRPAEGKHDALIHDYLDRRLAVACSMYQKRLTTYRRMGYAVVREPDAGLDVQPELFAQAPQ